MILRTNRRRQFFAIFWGIVTLGTTVARAIDGRVWWAAYFGAMSIFWLDQSFRWRRQASNDEVQK